jgi:hypothetical protein
MLVAELAAALAARLATTNVTVFCGVYLDEAAGCPSVFPLASLRDLEGSPPRREHPHVGS